MIYFRNRPAMFRLLLALFAAVAIHTHSAWAREIPCTSFKDKCKSLIFRMGSPKTGPGEYVIAEKTEIAPGYAAVVLNHGALGRSPNASGVFIVDSAGKHVLTLETFPERENFDLWIRLGKHGEGSLVVIGYEGHGFEVVKTKYFFDLGARKKLGAIKTGVDVDVSHIIEFSGAIYCIGNAISGNLDRVNAAYGIDDGSHGIVAIISPPATGQTAAQSAVPSAPQSQVEGTDHPHGQSPSAMDITILDKIGKQRIERILDARIAGDKLILIGKRHRYTLSNGIWRTSAAQAPAGLAGMREPAWRKPDRGLKLPGYPRWLVHDREMTDTRSGARYPLPQPSYKLFSQWRAEQVSDGDTEDTVSLENEIGPWQVMDGQLWFGLQFYDGEGTSGVGGIGTFDLATRKYKVNYLKEIAGDSSFAILVEPETIWLGLGVQPEGMDVGTGIAKISRSRHSVMRYEAPGIVNFFVRIRDKIFAGTTDGMMVLGDDGRVEKIELSVNPDGSYSPVARKVGEDISQGRGE